MELSPDLHQKTKQSNFPFFHAIRRNDRLHVYSLFSIDKNDYRFPPRVLIIDHDIHLVFSSGVPGIDLNVRLFFSSQSIQILFTFFSSY